MFYQMLQSSGFYGEEILLKTRVE